MSYLLAEPELLASVATEIDGIGSAIRTAGMAAAGPTSSLLAAAGDEVSGAIANLFSAYGSECQAVLAQVEAFRNEFAQTLAAAGVAYAQTEAASLAALRGALGIPSAGPAVSSASTIPPFTANLTSLFLGPTGVPIPDESYVQAANNLFVRSSDILRPLYTPEELYPLTGVKSLTLNASVEEGLTILDNAIMAQLSIPGNTVTVFGYSQSAIIASLEMQKLAALGASAPTASQLNFVLVGNEMNPNGGMLARFPDLSLPSLGLTFYGATPSDTIYPTAIYTLEYDGFADFPRYPLNFIADLNAVMGIPFVHVKYLDLTAAQVDSAIELPTSPGYSGVTSYYVIPTENLPLLEPLRAIPVIGNPLANLIQPDLKVIVNLGYGDPNYGYSTSYAVWLVPRRQPGHHRGRPGRGNPGRDPRFHRRPASHVRTTDSDPRDHAANPGRHPGQVVRAAVTGTGGEYLDRGGRKRLRGAATHRRHRACRCHHVALVQHPTFLRPTPAGQPHRCVRVPDRSHGGVAHDRRSGRIPHHRRGSADDCARHRLPHPLRPATGPPARTSMTSPHHVSAQSHRNDIPVNAKPGRGPR